MINVVVDVSNLMRPIYARLAEWGNKTDPSGRVPDDIVQINRDAIHWLHDWREDYAKTQNSIRMLKKSLDNYHPFDDLYKPTQHALIYMQNRARIMMVERFIIGDILRLSAYRYV